MKNNMNEQHKQYLGDGVYVSLENGMLKLTTENGISVQNTIYLEPSVYTALVNYEKKLCSMYEGGKAEHTGESKYYENK